MIVRIPSPPGFSSHCVLRQRVLLLWWHNVCQVATGGIVSLGTPSQTLKPTWTQLRQDSLAGVG
ncbi:hypothetical protein Hanom_Chr04g00325481 [Helianthus anomalus]